MERFNELQTAIAEIILKSFRPGTEENYDAIIEIDDFVNLWSAQELPRLAEIEFVMDKLGFKDDDARVDLGFYVVNPKKGAD